MEAGLDLVEQRGNTYLRLYAWGLVVQRDGKLVAAGGADQYGPNGGTFALIRYLAPLTCRVPDVRGRRLAAARHVITHAGCSVGRVTHAYSKQVVKGRVISQNPPGGVRRSEHAKVRLVVSKGRPSQGRRS